MPRNRIRFIITLATCATALVAAAPAHAGIMVETGRQLELVCSAYLNKSVRETENSLVETDSCKQYLGGFIRAFGVSRKADLTAELQGTASPDRDAMACFQLPDYLSFTDFARAVVAFVKRHPEYETRAAYQATAASLAAEYPCR
jgi:hypothetical protein